MKLTQPILVTGAAGFIGQRLVNKLAEQEEKIDALLLPHETIPKSFSEKVRIIRGDLTNPQSLKAIKKIGTLFHLAAMVGDWGSYEQHHQVTVQGTKNILELTTPGESRVILASSIVVYGSAIGLDICAEDHPFGVPQGVYSRCKQAQEKLAREYAERKNIKLTVIRPANVYGPGCQPWVHEVLIQLKKKRPVLVNGGDQNAGLCYVDNLVDLFILAAHSPKAVSQIYNACDDMNVTWNRYFSDLSSMAGLAKPKSLPTWLAKIAAFVFEFVWKNLKIKSRPPLTREAFNLVGSHHRIPILKAKEELNYEPKVPYSEGLEEIKSHIFY